MPIYYFKCKRCGRALKDPKSQIVGYGPICATKVSEDITVQKDLFDFESGS
jgi:hypothetical protein